jgi:beta-mannosidase
MAADLIPDPFVRDNEQKLMWVGETDWVYRRSFEVAADLLDYDCVQLECDGLDTLATVKVNGVAVIEADNMYRQWNADVRKALRPGTNTIEVTFASAMDYVNERRKQRPLNGGGADHRLPGNNWIRKEPCNFGWDWGPMCVTAGIWRPIRIRAWNVARLGDVEVRQTHAARRVTLDVSAAVNAVGRAAGLAVEVTVSLAGEEVERVLAPVARGRAAAELKVAKPKLWWPNGLGEQPLYDVTVKLLSADGEMMDSWVRRVGLRTLELIQQKDEWGHSFHFRCNGVDFFAKGANWIPNDVFQARVTRDDYEYQLGSAADAHMNMIRCWGGGIYEQDDFYDVCDELGLCVWQDFMFACSAYPAFDPAYMENVRAEFEDNVKRLRHHASLAIWCGNNELEQMRVIGDDNPSKMTTAEYCSLFDELIPSVLKRLDPARPYTPSSEHTPPKFGDRWKNPGDPTCGDAHLWAVWHGRQPFEWYRGAFHRFCSEFGFQSFPEPETVYGYTDPEERNVTSYVMELHQRSGIGNQAIIQYMLSWYRLPNGFENTLWLSQIQQGMAIKYAVEHWRRNRPRCMGAIYWQLNDCWPVASWASIDSLGRWKALHYMARAFYAPVMVSGVEDNAKGEVAVHVCSDERTPRAATLRWRATRVDGSLLDQGQKTLRIAANTSAKVQTLRLKPFIDQYTERDVVVWLSLEDGDGVVLSRNFVSFCRPKHMALLDPAIAVDVETLTADDGVEAFKVTLTAANPALWAWLELKGLDAQYSDNFICLEPDTPTEIIVSPVEPISAAAFRKALVVRSIRDTYA